MRTNLNDLLKNRYIICSCEGIAEKTIMNLLIDNDKICFCRADLINHEFTTLRKSSDIVEKFLTVEYGRDITILRILDREKDNFAIPKVYTCRRTWLSSKNRTERRTG